MRLHRCLLPAAGLTASLLGAWAGTGALSRDWRLHPAEVGASPDALRLPERVFSPQNSRGWQILSAPLTTAGDRGLIAASDGVYWDFELRVLVKREAEAAPVVGGTPHSMQNRHRVGAPIRVGCVLHYENEGSYGTLLWDTRTGALTLRSLRQKQATDVARGQAAFGDGASASLVVRVVTGDLTCYVNGEKVLTGRESSLLGRVAVFVAGGGVVQLDGLEVRALPAGDADADVFGRSRREFETRCAACHELDGPWNTRYAPDDWESVVNEMLVSEGADTLISRREANRIIDYLRLISLHPDRQHYRPQAEP